jgi:hypothetical protein
MSYDLVVYVREINDNIITDWIEELKKLHTYTEMHPDFSFNNQSGFLPCKIKITDCHNSFLNNVELLSGFELNINDYKYEKIIMPFWWNLLKRNQKNDAKKKLSEYNKELVFSISSQDSFEFRMAWYSAVIIAKLTNGVLFDPQVDIYYDLNLIIEEEIIIQVSEFEKILKDDDWRYHFFDGWVS